ncbi:hypothetical protein BO71DRAFT_443198 [Aspergillus ellipticus CBS 707.79]|uniref:Uncharacterized protein n=1 Tax=Aspergillus ellipticus CBS 707.79 TaxID=1448320 RepID=A0A319D2Z7_9EURO|nr:hypothetical protein BO71DRAFT_443198 [Aspergillus ellipticus CBS 707.79]
MTPLPSETSSPPSFSIPSASLQPDYSDQPNNFSRDQKRRLLVLVSFTHDNGSLPAYVPAYVDSCNQPLARQRYRAIAPNISCNPITRKLNVKRTSPVHESSVMAPGRAPHINAVVWVNWKYRVSPIKGTLEVHRSSGEVNEFIIHPAPAPGAGRQIVRWRRREFYPRGIVPTRKNPDDIIDWDVENLRDAASPAMMLDGLRPALI